MPRTVRNLRTERSPDGVELLYARCAILQAARSAGILLDTVYSDANNEEGSYAKPLTLNSSALMANH